MLKDIWYVDNAESLHMLYCIDANGSFILSTRHWQALLEKEIQNFMLCAARWTIRWFNKPKFHIFLHLVSHIRRFGPAILFATEAFESFNAVIRAKSVHSNCHAPSRDIARAFAQGNRIRHLMSGGLFLSEGHDRSHASGWRAVGPGPRRLVNDLSGTIVLHYLGLKGKREAPRGACGHLVIIVEVTSTKVRIYTGTCIPDGKPPHPFASVLTGQMLPASFPNAVHHKFKTSKFVYLHNGDLCGPGQFIIIRNPQDVTQTYVARAEEIIQLKGSSADCLGMPDAILVQSVDTSTCTPDYRMPRLTLADVWGLVRVEVYFTSRLFELI